MKSVTLVAFIGSWFCNSLTSRLRNWAEVIPEFDEELDVDVEEFEFDVFVEETVMTNSRSLRRRARGGSHCRVAIVRAFADQTDVAPNSGAESFGGMH
jgi:hypothetical protein